VTHAVVLRTAGKAVTVRSAAEAVTEWSVRYFGPWWSARLSIHAADGPEVVAEENPHRYEELAAAVTCGPYEETAYARAHTLVACGDDGVVTAVTPGEQLAYRYDPTTARLEISGVATLPVAVAAARLAREMMRGLLLGEGWSVLHASAVVHDDGRAVLALGGKGAGKTTTALTLATLGRLRLLANDRVFVRPNAADGVEVRPWPAAAAVGLGLLDALGWYDAAQQRLRAGESLHPTQDQRVTDALLTGRREPLWDGGRELKAQVWPVQFATWFGLELAPHGQAAVLLFPKVSADREPQTTEEARTLAEVDFMAGKTEDRYPDIFGLASGMNSGGQSEARATVAERLNRLPHCGVLLGHDVSVNAELLSKITS
jgi:hypothetical protein